MITDFGNIKLVTGTADAPISPTTALRHMRALQGDVDMVWLYVQAATELVEDYTGRSLLTKTYRLEMTAWPNQFDFLRSSDRLFGVQLRSAPQLLGVELRRSPLVAIDSVKYYSVGSSVLTTWDPANYRADTANLPGRLMFVDGVTFPDVDYRQDAIQIQFQAGYGTTPKDVPPMLRTAILMLAHHWFDERKPIVDLRNMQLTPMSLQTILRSQRVDTVRSV